MAVKTTRPIPGYENAGGWSQFCQWAGMDWFSNKPITPPKTDNSCLTPKKETNG